MDKIVIKGRPITKKNHSQIVRSGNRHILVPSKPYKAYEHSSLMQIPAKFRQRINYPVNVQCVYYMPTRRSVDLVNLLEATMDILVRAGVLEDDNCKIVAAHDGSRVVYDKYDPRVEIMIHNYHGNVLG